MIMMMMLFSSLHKVCILNNALAVSQTLQTQGIDAALYMEPELMSSILNRFPWDVVYQDSRVNGGSGLSSASRILSKLVMILISFALV